MQNHHYLFAFSYPDSRNKLSANPDKGLPDMLITAIRDYLITIGQASLQDLSRHFQVQESAMEQMLNFWLRKGIIRQIDSYQPSCQQSKCSDCFICPEGARKIYQAVTGTDRTIPITRLA
ncbi:hypothetical protein DKK71_09425 [Snodgrassella alvi]|nr:hypothetical protein DKK71_09425 [Snodgrassella alvi]